MAESSQVAKTVDNAKARRESLRIVWRRWVMEQPGGVDWLCTLVRVKEQDLGPHRYAWPPEAR